MVLQVDVAAGEGNDARLDLLDGSPDLGGHGNVLVLGTLLLIELRSLVENILECLQGNLRAYVTRVVAQGQAHTFGVGDGFNQLYPLDTTACQ